MPDISFYIPKSETIPTDLRLYVGDVYVLYERYDDGFLFKIFLDDEEESMKIAEQIAEQMERDHDEPEHGVSWRTVSFKIIPQEDEYKIYTLILWRYRVRDSF